VTARRWPTWLVVAVVMAAYIPGALLAFVGFGAIELVVFFLPAGITSSALVLTRRRQWPWILAGVAVSELSIDLSQGIDPSYVWGFALANTAEPLLGAYLLRRFIGREVDLARRSDLLAYLGCCVGCGPLLGGLIGGTTISVGADRGWGAAVLAFAIGDALGVLTVGGSILAWNRARPSAVGPWSRWAVCVAATIAVTVMGFWPLRIPLFYLPIPLLFWFGFSQSLMIMFTSGLAMTITANLTTSAGHGPWAALNISPQWNTLTLQLFLGISILGAWFLAVGVAERDTARSASRQLQQALLPVLTGGLGGVSVAAEYRPADRTHDVGGDWYDVFALPDGRIGLVVGDVVGHDLAAAAAMARLQAAVRIIAQSAERPAQLLERLDRASAVITDSLLTTVGYAEYDPTTRRLAYACAGHPPPVLVHDGDAELLWGGRSQPVGFPWGPRVEAECAVPPGATLVWYTDGLVERRDVPLRAALDRLVAEARALPDHDPEALCRRLLQRMSGVGVLQDDMVVLCVRFTPASIGASPANSAHRTAPTVAPGVPGGTTLPS